MLQNLASIIDSGQLYSSSHFKTEQQIGNLKLPPGAPITDLLLTLTFQPWLVISLQLRVWLLLWSDFIVVSVLLWSVKCNVNVVPLPHCYRGIKYCKIWPNLAVSHFLCYCKNYNCINDWQESLPNRYSTARLCMRHRPSA